MAVYFVQVHTSCQSGLIVNCYLVTIDIFTAPPGTLITTQTYSKWNVCRHETPRNYYAKQIGELAVTSTDVLQW